jgi:hypothetical protein
MRFIEKKKIIFASSVTALLMFARFFIFRFHVYIQTIYQNVELSVALTRVYFLKLYATDPSSKPLVNQNF